MLLSWLLSLLSALAQEPAPAPPPANTTARPRTILVEGNVGSGKSSFLEIMSSVAGVEVFQEPVDLWRNVGGDNLFEKMIKEPRRWTATFQLYSTRTRSSTVAEARVWRCCVQDSADARGPELGVPHRDDREEPLQRALLLRGGGSRYRYLPGHAATPSPRRCCGSPRS